MSQDKPTPVPAGLMNALFVVLGALVVGFLALSAADLYTWANSPTGLGQPAHLAWILPFAFDFGALVCIIMTLICATRGDRPGAWSVGVWLLAGFSAYSQMRHGFAERDAGRAQDLWWAMPTVALVGPFLLHLAVRYFRRFRRVDAGEQMAASPGFGVRWLPGIAFRETWAAWRVARQEGIGDAAECVTFVRDRDALRHLSHVDAVRYALAELATRDAHEARKWLQRRGITVTQQVMDEVDAQVSALSQPRRSAARRTDAAGVAAAPASLEVPDAPPVRQKVPVPAEPVAPPATDDRDALTEAVRLVRQDGLTNREAVRRVGLPEQAGEAAVRRALKRINGHEFAAVN